MHLHERSHGLVTGPAIHVDSAVVRSHAFDTHHAGYTPADKPAERPPSAIGLCPPCLLQSTFDDSGFKDAVAGGAGHLGSGPGPTRVALVRSALYFRLSGRLSWWGSLISWWDQRPPAVGSFASPAQAHGGIETPKVAPSPPVEHIYAVGLRGDWRMLGAGGSRRPSRGRLHCLSARLPRLTHWLSPVGTLLHYCGFTVGVLVRIELKYACL